MVYTTEQVRKMVSNKKYWSEMSMFIGHDKDEVLWYDKNENVYCINKFTIVDGEIEFAPMPHQSYHPA